MTARINDLEANYIIPNTSTFKNCLKRNKGYYCEDKIHLKVYHGNTRQSKDVSPKKDHNG